MPTVVSAVDVHTQLGAFAGEQGADFDKPQSPLLVVASGIKIFLSLLGILFLAYTLYAGFTIMTARGEEEKVTEGKKTLMRAVIGMVVVMSAYSITLFAAKLATGDYKHQGDYTEISDPDLNFQDTDQRNDVQHVTCPLGLRKQPDGTCGSYENEPE